MLEVEFSVSEGQYLFVGLSAAESCRVCLEKMLPRGDGRYAEFFSVRDVEADRVRASAQEAGVWHRVVRTDEGGPLVEVEVGESCPAVTLAELGAIPKSVTADDGEGRVDAEVMPGDDAEAIMASFLDAHPEFELAAKRRRDSVTPFVSEREFERGATERLTERQYEVLVAAFEAGYYDRPRSARAASVADDLGISSATFSQHVRTAERKLVAALYESRE